MKLVCLVLVLAIFVCCGKTAQAEDNAQKELSEKINIGKILALYPSLATVVGTEVNSRVNWLVVAHTGIIGHSHILVSMNKGHYSNRGIIASRKLSINLIDRAMLAQADYVGTISGADVDKSNVFAWHKGENGSPIIDSSPLAMELDVIDNYELDGFDNFICSIANTYAKKEVLDANGRLNYNVLKPVLFEFPTYSYLATGEMLGKCRQLQSLPGMTAKEPMQADGIVRLSRIEIDPQYLGEYRKIAAEVGEASLRNEPGVLTMYAVAEKDNPCQITILETYASQDAYKKHIASEHFQKYKQASLKMVKSLQLVDQQPLNPENRLNNYMEGKY